MCTANPAGGTTALGIALALLTRTPWVAILYADDKLSFSNAMGIEIERKFLVQNDTWRNQAGPGVRYRQGYLATTGECSIRARIEGDEARLNIKSATAGIARTEFEYRIPVADAAEMLEHFCPGLHVVKMRYRARVGEHTWEIDEFEGENAGLVVAEIELSSAHESFERPAWLGKEVSDDLRYYNTRLSEHPFKDW